MAPVIVLLFLGPPVRAADPGLAWRQQKVLASDGEEQELFGCELSDAGDLDADGYADVLVGAYYDNDEGHEAGAAYLYFGYAGGVDTSREDKITAESSTGGDGFGSSLSTAGDVDGDGFVDLLIGAAGVDDGGSSDVGAVYVYYGGVGGRDVSREDVLLSSDVEEDGGFGASVADAGDLDGDGLDDVVVGAPGSTGTEARAGAVYVYYGEDGGIAGGREDKIYAESGEARSQYGNSLSSAGDQDGDGYADIVVGATYADATTTDGGRVYLYFGGSAGLDRATEQVIASSDMGLGDNFGFAVHGADIDADGYTDLVVGAPCDGTSTAQSGSIYVYYGSSTGPDASREQEIAPSDGADWDYFGFTLWAGGDADGDGYADLIVGAWNRAEVGDQSGTSYFYRGGSDGLDASTEEQLLPTDAKAGDIVGCSVAMAGDIDADGHDEVLVGSAADDNGDAAGALSVFYRYDDADGDGVFEGSDCDDDDASIGATDADGDNWTACGGDCDETDSDVHPEADEIAGDGTDQDCDGVESCYPDADGDGYGGEEVIVSEDVDCVDPAEASAPGDCDDSDAAISPAATEAVGDEVDQDCDGGELCYADLDEDGFAAADGSVKASENSNCVGSTEARAGDPGGDCDDDDATVYPGAPELADGIDHDCDGAPGAPDTADGGGTEEGAGCRGEDKAGCATGGAAGARAAALALLLVLRRRRDR